MKSFRLQGIFLLGLLAGSLPAQKPTPISPDRPGYTLHSSARIVLTDVTVTDKDGNPVRGLQQSAFRIRDNRRSQQIASFEEHTSAGVEQLSTPLPTHVFSNEYLAHPPAVSNVILIDSSNLALLDQMYLADQLKHLVQRLPSSEPIAIYSRVGLLTLLVQSFTADHDLLLKAVGKAVPMFRQPDAQYAGDMDALNQMVAQLQDVPGRKNILWFSGGSSLYLIPDAGAIPADFDLKPLYDELEKGRIAIYPIDARGLTATPNPAAPMQDIAMEDVAEATGGRLVHSENGFARATARIISDASEFYTLTYVPHELRLDNRWHSVKVDVDEKNYTLSYRRGYFDDGNNLTVPASGERLALTAGGEKRPAVERFQKPVIFSASAEPSGYEAVGRQNQTAPHTPLPKNNETTYTVRFYLPASEFVHGQPKVVVQTGILALNLLGRPLGRLTRTVTLQVDEAKFQAHPDGFLSFDQQINLHRGEDSLYVVVADTATGRTGTVNVPLDVAKRKEQACSPCAN